MVSCGIGNDITFEDKFIDKYKVPCIVFDNTINDLPKHNNNIQFIKKNISNTETENTTNLLNIIEKNDNIFLKMDIETWEYVWINVLKLEHLQKINQIVIEFHFPYTYSENIFKQFSYPLEVEYKLNCLKKLTDTFYLIHLHPNNCCSTHLFENVIIPNVFECTFIRKDLCSSISNNTKSIPDPSLDKKNVINNPDIYLACYPYIH